MERWGLILKKSSDAFRQAFDVFDLKGKRALTQNGLLLAFRLGFETKEWAAGNLASVMTVSMPYKPIQISDTAVFLAYRYHRRRRGCEPLPRFHRNAEDAVFPGKAFDSG